MCVQPWFRKVPQHRRKRKQTPSMFSGALLKQGLRVQLWSHPGCDGRDESGCKLTGNEGLYKWTWRIYILPDNPCAGQLSLQGSESTEFGHEVLFRSQCYFSGVLIFLGFSCSMYIQSARLPDLPACPRRQTLIRQEKDRKELFCLSHVRRFQVTSVHLPLAFHVLQLADWIDELFHTGKKQAPFSPSLCLLQTWADSKCNSQLQTPFPASPSWGMSDSLLQSTALQTKPARPTFPIHTMWHECNIVQTFY